VIDGSFPQNGLGIIGDTIANSPEILHIPEHLVTSRIGIVCCSALMEYSFEPIGCIWISSPRTQWCGTLGTEGQNVRGTRRGEG